MFRGLPIDILSSHLGIIRINTDVDTLVASHFRFDEWSDLDLAENDLYVVLDMESTMKPSRVSPPLTFTQFDQFVNRPEFVSADNFKFVNGALTLTLDGVLPTYLCPGGIVDPKLIPELTDHLNEMFPRIYPTPSLCRIKLLSFFKSQGLFDWDLIDDQLRCSYLIFGLRPNPIKDKIRSVLNGINVSFDNRVQIISDGSLADGVSHDIVITDGLDIYERLWKQQHLDPMLIELNFLPTVISRVIGTYVHSRSTFPNYEQEYLRL